MFIFTPKKCIFYLSQFSPNIGWSKIAPSYLYSILFLYGPNPSTLDPKQLL